MTANQRSLEELTRTAMSLLVRELGASDAARFLAQYQTDRGDYTDERSQTLSGISEEQYRTDLDRIKRAMPVAN